MERRPPCPSKTSGRCPPTTRTASGSPPAHFRSCSGAGSRQLLLLVAVQGASRRVAGAFGFAVVGALALTAILQFWFGSLDGNYLLTSAVVALGIAATAWTILGLRSAIGNVGVAIWARNGDPSRQSVVRPEQRARDAARPAGARSANYCRLARRGRYCALRPSSTARVPDGPCSSSPAGSPPVWRSSPSESYASAESYATTRWRHPQAAQQHQRRPL